MLYEIADLETVIKNRETLCLVWNHSPRCTKHYQIMGDVDMVHVMLRTKNTGRVLTHLEMWAYSALEALIELDRLYVYREKE